MTNSPATDSISYAGYRFPPEVISYAVWLYFRFPLSLHIVEEMLAARSIEFSYETLRAWALKFDHQAAKRVREKVMRRYKLACQLQRFLSAHDQVANQFMRCRYNRDAKQKRGLRTQAFAAWNKVPCAKMAAE